MKIKIFLRMPFTFVDKIGQYLYSLERCLDNADKPNQRKK